MLSMVRSLLYRIMRSRVFIVYVAIICLCALATPFALWLYEVWPAFAATGLIELPDEPLPALQLYGISLVEGSFLSALVSLMMGYFVANDFKSGFVKNLVQAEGGRLSYVFAAMACAIVLSLAITAVGTAAVGLALFLQGFPLVAPETGEVLQWLLQVALCISAYAAIAVLLGIASGSEMVAVVGGLLLGEGAVEFALQLILANVPGLPACVRDCLDGYLVADLGMLAQGTVCDSMTYVQAAVTLLVAGAFAALVMRRRSLG